MVYLFCGSGVIELAHQTSVEILGNYVDDYQGYDVLATAVKAVKLVVILSPMFVVCGAHCDGALRHCVLQCSLYPKAPHWHYDY